MKALHIAANLSPEWGGPAKVVIELAEALHRKSLDISIFTTIRKGDLFPTCPKGVDLQLFTQSFLAKLWTCHSLDLARAVQHQASKFDLIHIHEIWHHPCYAAYRAARKAGKPYVITVHGALAPWALNYKVLKKKIYAALIQKHILNGAAATHAITQEEVNHIRAFRVSSPVAVIPNGIDPEKFQGLPPREELEKLYPKLEGKKIILFLGRIHPIKGLDILVKAFGKIAKIRGDVRLVVAGPDSAGYQNQVERLLKTEGVLDKTVFTGMLTGQRKLAALSRADIFVLPSYSEGFSMSILEAMACGLPVVITRQCHFPEIAEARAGIVVVPDANQLAEALARLLDEPQLRKEMGANGRRLVQEKFTWDKVAEQMIRLYRDVLEGGMDNYN